MRYLAFLGILFGISILSAYPQSRRVPPGGTVKQNDRPAPSPTPTQKPSTIQPEEVSTSVDSGDVIAVDTSLVTIPVRVLDRRNRFIGGLKEESLLQEFKEFPKVFETLQRRLREPSLGENY